MGVVEMRNGELDYDAEIRVTPAPVPQPVTCPDCGTTFKEPISEQISAASCPSCNAMIRLHPQDRDSDTDTDRSDGYATEQTTLLPDGGSERRGQQ